ncbi:MAG TPA: hypothetical protein VK937_21980 [Candidatus Limnocylindria bacterium]|nr:hypothetical protein [Candidatus Limnocylindria bacterium]
MAASFSSRAARRCGVSPLKRFLLAVLLVAFPFLLTSSLWAQRGASSSGRSAGVAQINVQVRNPNGTAAPRGIHVRLESEEGGAADDCVTESGGKCRFQPNSSGMHVAWLNQIGYKEVSVHVNLVDSLRGYVTLDLNQKDPKEHAPLADNPATLFVLFNLGFPLCPIPVLDRNLKAVQRVC